jgi:putative transposase
MTVYHSLSHLRRDCEYHVAFLRSEGKSGFSECCVDSCGRYREAPGIEDCRRAPDGASRAYVSIPPKYAVVNVIGCIKGKSATQIARTFGGRRCNFTAETFGHAFTSSQRSAWGKTCSEPISANQEEEDERYEQMKCGIYTRRLGGSCFYGAFEALTQ